jgi:hypothetical protein
MRKTDNKKVTHRILKLTTGEEIITKITGQTKNKFIINDPMLFVLQHVQNGPYMGTMSVLKKWIEHSGERTIRIPKDLVISIVQPNKNACELYDMELEQVIEAVEENKIAKFDDIAKNKKKQPPFDQMSTFPPSMIEDMMNSTPESVYDEIFNTELPADMMDKEKFDMIAITLMMHPSIINELIDADIVDKNMFNDAILDALGIGNNGPIKNDPEYTGNDKDHPEYGNRLTDWHWDLNDDEWDLPGN